MLEWARGREGRKGMRGREVGANGGGRGLGRGCGVLGGGYVVRHLRETVCMNLG